MQPGRCFVEFWADEVEKSVPQRFEQQAILYPERIAVQTKNQTINYREFNNSANQIARTLRQRSASDQPVALLLDHDLPAILAIFGVLKAAKSFTPLDPSLPRSRLAYMLDNSEAEFVVTSTPRFAIANELIDSSQIINVDQIDTCLDTGNLDIPIRPQDMSCILYTSGTTGRPKGVIHTHQNELHNVMHHTNTLHLNHEDRLTLLGSYSTGQGMQDLYCALLNGATLCPWNLKLDGLSGLAEWLIKERITIYHSAATVFRHLIRTLNGREGFPNLRVIRLGSEHVSWKDVEACRQYFANECVFVNALSSSETKTIVQYVITRDTEVSGFVPVGYAVVDTQILILDNFGNGLGPNRPGEIAVRSRFLSPGYWRALDATSAAYVSDSGCLDNRLFRTGEWGRMSSDGCLEHLGRKDSQVKIRGYRVETHETELALLHHPAVDHALVLPRENNGSDKYLAAYMTANASGTPTVRELRTFLKDRIPEYMIPAAFVFLESFPITPNGKVDYNALPDPSSARSAPDTPFVPPNSPIEQGLAVIWREILGVNEIGVEDNHFELGGNSLTLMQVAARVEKQFRVSLSLKQFFESPTIIGLSRAILFALGAASPADDARIGSAPRDQILPLSFSQQRLWFLEQWEPDTPVYNICRAYRLVGPLDMEALRQSANALVERHEVLRTCFPALEGQPRQSIYGALELQLPSIDLRGMAERERIEKSLQLVNEEGKQPFKLSEGSMLRVKLIRLTDNDHIFIFTVHQIICDGWSMQVLRREFWTIYEALTKKIAIPMAVPALQYIDFALWQRQWLRDSVLDSQITYWKKQLGERLPILNLPTDHCRPLRQSFRGSRQSIVLPRSLTQELRELARREEVTLFICLMAAFQSLLHRYVQENDLIVGFPIANRNWTETAGLVGPFVNTLVLRTDFSGEPRFNDLLFKVREGCLGAYAHQDLPFDKLIEELRLTRDLTRNPLFQAMFVLQVPENSLPGPRGIVTEPWEVDTGTSKLDLTLSLVERDEKLVGFVEYSTDLFERSTIVRLIGHYQMLLEGIVSDPNRRLWELPLLSKGESRQLLVERNDTNADYPNHECIHKLFEKQAEQTPYAVAVIFHGQQLSYRELNARANQLASYLISLGVGTQSLVGICVDRSLDMVIALLGILKTGAAYVPLDPSYPKERLVFMLEDAGISVIVTQAKTVENGHLCRLSGKPEYVCLDRDWPSIEEASNENPDMNSNSDTLAYIIYTSGSTGTPKGVQVSHRSVINCLLSIGDRIGLTSRDRLLAVTTISFDIAALEIYLPLLVGGRVVGASREEVADGNELVRLVTKYLATVMQATPYTWRMLIDAGWEGSPEFKILCGSESLPRDLAETLLTRGELWNCYGPSETTIWSSIYKVESAEGPVPIGVPLANTQIYILDSHLQPVPIGVHGDLYIGGDGLAQGYLNQPELTGQKFIPDPYSSGGRLYNTGDRARYLADGNIEFLGRLDNQVKIRGHRIELGEIEAALNQHPAVKESVVVARANDASSEHRLVGYIVPKQQPGIPVDALRQFLADKLPQYMVPSTFILLDNLPVTPNGKIDRNSLPPPDGTRPDLTHEFVTPRTEIEELVAQVWRDVLRIAIVGVYDNFFDVGGHSLLATRVVARLRTNFAIDVPLRRLFELPTVSGLATYIKKLLQDQSGTTSPPIVPVRRDRFIPASFSQERLWFLRELAHESTAYNISSVFSVHGPLDVRALEEALNTIIARHEILRTTFDVVDHSLIQYIRPILRIQLSVSDVDGFNQDVQQMRVREIALEEARKPFDLCDGPLFRAKILKVGENSHYLLLHFDHTILDGFSMGVFFKELGILYGGFINGERNSLSPLPIQFADYAVWQRNVLHGDALTSELEYWKSHLADLPLLSIPADYRRPAIQTSRGVRKSVRLSKESTDSLTELSRREGVTVFMTLLAAFQLLLSRYTGQDDVVVGSTIAGRSRAETEGLIGFFVNALPMRTNLSGSPTFRELLKRVREVCLGAYTHQDVPFERIVEAINPARDLSRNPLFQIMFNMADISERELRLPGCEVAKESFFDPAAKFDVTLYAPEKDGSIELAMVYNADLFSESRISIMLEQFRYLLSQILENPNATICEYSLIFPSTCSDLPDPIEPLDDTWEGPVHCYVAEWAERAPDRIAVADADGTWTYSEIEIYSDQLATYLIAHGVHAKDVIGVYAHRSGGLVVALLGILKAGAAFVILDPAYPPARLIAYLRISKPRGWIQMDAAKELPEELGNYLGGLDLSCSLKVPRGKEAPEEVLREQAETQARVIVGANDPAYVAFTSGSTGDPKGVLSRHGPITHFLPWQKEAFDLHETDRFCLLSGLAYNHLHRDIFTALYLGATLYIPPAESVRDPEQLNGWLRRNAISVLHLTPALGELLLTAAVQPLPAVRWVFFGGDVLTGGEVARIRELAPDATIGCFYGATETQRAVGYYEIPGDFARDRDPNQPVPLGRGIKDVQLLLLNASGRLTGIGELGELYVRSPHLAEGYVGDAALTNHMFVPNPFTKNSSDRLYRTGELGRYLPDGSVDWAGRNDRRVNIRGFRAELGEIESVLKQHPTVRDAAVILQQYGVLVPENSKLETQNPELLESLVAYVVADDDAQSLRDLLHDYLRTRLPEYMVPAHFLILEQLPLNPNGKVDYRALPPVHEILSESSSSLFAPRNEVEAKLSMIFCQVLGREQVGIEENFFRLGGHSLLAAQAAARIRDAFGIGLDLRTFLESPAVLALAKYIEVRIKPADTTPTANADNRDREDIEL